MPNVIPVVVITILRNGDIEYGCSHCDKTEVVPLDLSESPFWDVHNGRAVLTMIHHCRNSHLLGKVNA